MKAFLLTICLLHISVFASAQWTWQNPLPTSNTINSVWFTDDNSGYIVGRRGTISKTMDGGTTWTGLKSGILYDLMSVFFTAPNIGYAVGNYGTILKTINGGANWTVLPTASHYNLKSNHTSLPELHKQFLF